MSAINKALVAASSIPAAAAGTVLEFVDNQSLIWNLKNSAGAFYSDAWNVYTAAQTPTATTRTYIAGTNFKISTHLIQTTTAFRWTIPMTKTAAGIATSTFDVCFGTAGTTADTARVSFTKPAGTAAGDEGKVVIECFIRTIGASGIAVGEFSMIHNLATTGHMTQQICVLNTVSSAFDLTSTALNVGVCITTGASDAITISSVIGESWNI